MAEQTQAKAGAETTGASPSTAITRQERDASQKGPGTTRIADSVVTKVAGIAAREVSGVYQLGGSATRAIGNVTQRVGLGDGRSQGVSVEVGERQAAIDLTVVVEYGESIPHITQQIRAQVVKRVEGITGLEVTEVNIEVDDLHFEGDDDALPAESRVA